MRKFKIFFIALSLVLLCIAFAPKTYARVVLPDPNPGVYDPVEILTIKDEGNNKKIEGKSTEKLTCTCGGTNVTPLVRQWISSDTSIAKVSSDGYVTGVSVGKVTITATYRATRKTIIGSIELEVTNYPVFNVTIKDDGDNVVYYGGSEKLSYEYSPSKGTPKTISWYSTNPMIALVNQEGVVTGTGLGSTDIKLKIKDFNGSITTGSIRITVKQVLSTSIKINSERTIEMSTRDTKKLTATITPTNVTNNRVKWESSNPSVATINEYSGEINCLTAGTTYIKVTTCDSFYSDSPITDQIKLVVKNDVWTIMIYMCGSSLESYYSFATSDIKEILSVSNQPSDVNIIIQTGGTKRWSYTYGVNSSYIQRWHVSGQQLVQDVSLQNANMGAESTFQSFLEWGLTEYPAEKTGIILWDHGRAMKGVCCDENYSNDPLLNSEVKGALTSAFANTGRKQKLEFIGYDACLMSVQDIAEFNSNFFNYMIASEEEESGYGWDYDTWVDDLYRKSSTTTILRAIVDGLIEDNGGVNDFYNKRTLSYVNLSYMQAYKDAWENMASALADRINDSNSSEFNELIKSVKHYSGSDYTEFGIFDAKDFVNKLSGNSTFNPGSTYTNAVLKAFNNLVEYSSCGEGAGDSNGLCMFWSIDPKCNQDDFYNEHQTNFTNWRNLVSSFGY